MRTAAICLGALTVGCAPLAPYVPPASGPGAEVRFVAATLGGTADVVAAGDPGCAEGGRLIARLHERQPPDVRPVYLPDGGLAPLPTAEVRVASGRRLDAVVQAQGLLDGWYEYACARAVSFTPAAGERYDVVYINTDPYRCAVDVWRIEAGGARTRVADARSERCPLRAYRPLP